jgi:serine/threonine protein phosphatase PrpC
MSARQESAKSSAAADKADGPTIDVRMEDSDEPTVESEAPLPLENHAAAAPLHSVEALPDVALEKKEHTFDSTVIESKPAGALAVEESPKSKRPSAERTDEEREPIQVRVFGRTDVGQIREHNEDNFLVADLTKGSRGLMELDRLQIVGKRGTLLGVCDGMGGAAAGEVASQLAVDIVYEKMTSGDPPATRVDLAARLVNAIESAGLRIFTEAKADRSRRGMGTTATIATLVDDHLFLGQVGDSRGYLLRGDRLVQVTRDQSLVNQLIEAGQLTEEEAENFEHNNIILQALGTAESVQVDLTYVELRQGDTLLLCSDGLSGMVRNDEIREVLRSIDEPLEACRELTDRANQAGGHDNVTVVIARFGGDGLKPLSKEDVASLKYRKFDLPESPSSSQDRRGHAPISSTRPIDDDLDYPGSGVDSIRVRDEAVDLPRQSAPSWLATMIIVSAVTCVVVLGYYFLVLKP